MEETISNNKKSNVDWYLIYFFQLHLNFRRAEFVLLCEMYGGKILEIEEEKNASIDYPFIRIKIEFEENVNPKEVFKKICERSILIRTILKEYVRESTFDALIKKFDEFDTKLIDPHISSDKTFKIQFEGYNKKIQREEFLDKIDLIITNKNFKWDAKAKMKNPDNFFWAIEVFKKIVKKKKNLISFLFLFRKKKRASKIPIGCLMKWYSD